MKTRPIVLESKLLPNCKAAARIAVCDTCGSEQFLVLLLYEKDKVHPHFQCARCDSTYCSGDCPGPEEVIEPSPEQQNIPWTEIHHGSTQ